MPGDSTLSGPAGSAERTGEPASAAARPGPPAAPPRGDDPDDLTLATYSATIGKYLAASTPPSADLRQYLDRVAGLVGAGGQVLELGSGPGQDADYLETRGLRVTRTDATPEFVTRLNRSGHGARVLDVRHDAFGGPYDAVLADAVLLHLDREQFQRALGKARQAVHNGGVLALTLKEGDGQAWSTAKLDRPRHFAFWREDPLRRLLAAAGWSVHRLDHVRGRTEPWLFVIATARAEATAPPAHDGVPKDRD